MHACMQARRAASGRRCVYHPYGGRMRVDWIEVTAGSADKNDSRPGRVSALKGARNGEALLFRSLCSFGVVHEWITIARDRLGRKMRKASREINFLFFFREFVIIRVESCYIFLLHLRLIFFFQKETRIRRFARVEELVNDWGRKNLRIIVLIRGHQRFRWLTIVNPLLPRGRIVLR